jgi:hypothetical protein
MENNMKNVRTPMFRGVIEGPVTRRGAKEFIDYFEEEEERSLNVGPARAPLRIIAGQLVIDAYDRNGVHLWRTGDPNLVVTRARIVMPRLLAGDVSPAGGGAGGGNAAGSGVITYMNWGDGGHDPSDPIHVRAGVPDVADEDLYCVEVGGTPLAGEAVITTPPPGKTVTHDYPDGDSGTKVRFICTLGLAEGNGPGSQAISEAALYSLNGDLFAHKAFGLITKTAEFSLTFRWTIVF